MILDPLSMRPVPRGMRVASGQRGASEPQACKSGVRLCTCTLQGERGMQGDCRAKERAACNQGGNASYMGRSPRLLPPEWLVSIGFQA